MPVVLHASVSAGTGATHRLELIALIFTLFAKKFTPTEPGEKLWNLMRELAVGPAMSCTAFLSYRPQDASTPAQSSAAIDLCLVMSGYGRVIQSGLVWYAASVPLTGVILLRPARFHTYSELYLGRMR